LGIERGSTRLPCLENTLCIRLWTCRKAGTHADKAIVGIIKESRCVGHATLCNTGKTKHKTYSDTKNSVLFANTAFRVTHTAKCYYIFF
jgi:hypothetical protein